MGPFSFRSLTAAPNAVCLHLFVCVCVLCAGDCMCVWSGSVHVPSVCSCQCSSVSGPLGANRPGFVLMSCCLAVYCTEWALRSEPCENPTLAHLGTFSSACYCVCVCVCSDSLGWEVLGEKGLFTLKRPLCVGQYIIYQSFISSAREISLPDD